MDIRAIDVPIVVEIAAVTVVEIAAEIRVTGADAVRGEAADNAADLEEAVATAVVAVCRIPNIIRLV